MTPRLSFWTWTHKFLGVMKVKTKVNANDNINTSQLILGPLVNLLDYLNIVGRIVLYHS